MSDDNEDADGPDGDKGAGHSDPHRNSNDSEVHAGGLTLSVKRFSSRESSGSATSLTSMAPHLAHSNIRFSEWPAPTTISANRIRVRHLTQRGYSMGRRAASIWLPGCKNIPATRLSSVRSLTHGFRKYGSKRATAFSPGNFRNAKPERLFVQIEAVNVQRNHREYR
jgi:hypothetical protein